MAAPLAGMTPEELDRAVCELAKVIEPMVGEESREQVRQWIRETLAESPNADLDAMVVWAKALFGDG